MPSAPASEICFLSGLPAKTAGQKVRFLGCVTDYDPIAGVLTLQHQYQHQPSTASTSASASGAAAPSSPSAVHARVNVDLVLERLTAEQMTVGAWVNVMGYVTEAKEAAEAAAAGNGRSAPSRRRGPPTTAVNIQAILLWSTGPLDVQAYERQLSEMLDLKPGT